MRNSWLGDTVFSGWHPQVPNSVTVYTNGSILNWTTVFQTNSRTQYLRRRYSGSSTSVVLQTLSKRCMQGHVDLGMSRDVCVFVFRNPLMLRHVLSWLIRSVACLCLYICTASMAGVPDVLVVHRVQVCGESSCDAPRSHDTYVRERSR